jgi:hypothetical protein
MTRRRQLKKNAGLSKRERRAIVVSGTVVVGLVVVAGVLVYAARPQPVRTNPTTIPNPAPQRPGPEPYEGYEARWDARREKAMRRCRLDAEVQTWAQAVTCALNVAYPEAAPWTDPSTWTPWMQHAHALVEADMLEVAGNGNPSPPVWAVQLWLRGDREILACQGLGDLQLAPCVAGAIYPEQRWPPVGRRGGWQVDFYDEVQRRIAARRIA